MKKSILLIEDDPKTAQSAREILGGEYELAESKSLEGALKVLGSKKFDLILYDLDMPGGHDLEGYKKVRRIVPRAKVIVISVLNDIPLAVSASKIGVLDFLRKPLDADRLKESVSRNVVSEKRAVLNFAGIEDVTWLKGIGDRIKTLYGDLEKATASYEDVILFGERGIDKESLARVLHGVGPLKARRLASLDLASFGREFTEGHFWSTIQELMQERAGDIDEEELCGTIFLKGIESLNDHFVLSILEFLKKRKASENLENIDKKIRVVLSVEDPVKLAGIEGRGEAAQFVKLSIPPLRERREDIPLLVEAYLRMLSGRNNKRVRAVTTDVLSFFVIYDWPGNYRELELMISLAVLRAKDDVVSMRDIAADVGILRKEYLAEVMSSSPVSLHELRHGFEKKFYELVLLNVEGDVGRAASFLDIPKTAFVERMHGLGL